MNLIRNNNVEAFERLYRVANVTTSTLELGMQIRDDQHTIENFGSASLMNFKYPLIQRHP